MAHNHPHDVPELKIPGWLTWVGVGFIVVAVVAIWHANSKPVAEIVSAPIGLKLQETVVATEAKTDE